MSKEGRNVPHFHAEEDKEVPRHKCCWVAILSLCLLTVNSIVCINLARRLAYVEGQLAKQGVSDSEETSTEKRFGHHTELQMSDGTIVHSAAVFGNKMKEHRPYNGPALPSSPREHQNRKRRSDTKTVDIIEDVRLIHQEHFGFTLYVHRIEGDLTVKVGVRWFHVCQKTFGRQEADVACQHLYKDRSTRLSKGRHETFWSPVVSCEGDERKLGECRMVAANASCEDGHSVRLSCLTVVLFRLFGGQKSNEGRVVFHRARGLLGWGTVCNKGWDISASEVLCRHLGYKGAIPIAVDFGPGSGMIWLSDVRCAGNESTIMECQYKYEDIDCDHDDDVGVVCDVDECNSNPCQNNGSCTEGVGHYICQCERGWVGVHCEIKENLPSMEVTSRDWAHIKAASDSKAETHTVKRRDTVLTKQWEQLEPSDKFRFQSGILTVLEEGDYYIYSQVYYWYSNKTSPVVSHSVMVVKSDKGNPYRFLTCWKNMQQTDPWNTCYTAGVIHLFSNNSVYLHMRCDGCVIKLDHDATFFGVMKLSNFRGQHKSLDLNVLDKVEDVPPTVAHDHRVQTAKSNFEKLMRNNFLNILNELPNGHKYRINSRGKIVLR